MLTYSEAVLERAARAWRCSPFRQRLWVEMAERGVKLSQIAGPSGYTHRILSEDEADAELMWLISVGALRREVDGQGITDSYRLAPLGRFLLEQPVADPSPFDHLSNLLARWRWRG